jgi:subtilisin family serine protease
MAVITDRLKSQLMPGFRASLIVILASLLVVSQARVASFKPARPLFAPGEVIVKLRVEARSDFDESDQLLVAAQRVCETRAHIKVASVERLADNNTTISEIVSRMGLDRIFVLKFDPNADIDSIIAALRSDPMVEYAEPNYLIETASIIPDDPDFSRQWALRNLGIGVEGQPSTLDSDIKATDAWEITTGSPDVVVAVTDTGVDINHPDLVGNIYTNPREIPANGVDDDANGYIDDLHGFNVAERNPDVSDIVGHGTQMSGVIAAKSNNGIGITGISQSKIMPVRFFRRTGPDPADIDATVADAARALLYSIAAGAKIINASWRTLLRDVSAADAQAFRDAVTATRDAGALLVCIAGNEGFDNDSVRVYPGAYQMENQIVVAASDYNDEMWHPINDPVTIKSGYGKRTVHLTAPGALVRTTLARGNCVTCSQSSDPEDWYEQIDGTSPAAAYVSGVAALIHSRFPDVHYSVVRRRIIESVERRQTLDRYVITGGRLNALGALTIELQITPPALTKLKYKSKGKKLLIDGLKMQRDASVIVGGVAYSTTPAADDLLRMEAKIPKSAFPSGVAVEVYLRNPDGGESQRLAYRR